MNHNKTPLWTALQSYAKDEITPFHTPGHKLKPGAFISLEEVLGKAFFALDPSDEISSVEFNNDFETALKQAEGLAANLFGAQDSLFLVNGTTGGLHYLLMPTTGYVIIPRFSHQAVYSGLMLSEGREIYLPTSYDLEWAIPLPPSIEQIEESLKGKAKQAIVLTHPTYYGTVPDLEKICNLAHKNGTMVFADEAHGGHFAFSKRLPQTALECGADAVVQSTHKTLGSFTQTSMLHSSNSEWFSKIVQAKSVLQTTSPSLVFLGVLDEVRRVLASKGVDLMERAIELADCCATQLSQIKGVEVLPKNLQSDPTKVVFSLRELGITGIELEFLLRKDYNIQLELSDYYSVLALITLGDTEESITRLVWAIRDLVQRISYENCRPLPKFKLNIPDLPPNILGLKNAFYTDKEIIPLQKAKGRISGSFLTHYPPGVPVIVPGEEFTSDIIEYLLWCSHINWTVRGLMEGKSVSVLKENNAFSRNLR